MSRPLRIYVASSWRNDLQPSVIGRLVNHPSSPEVYDFRNPHSVDGVRRGTHGRGFHWSDLDTRWKDWDSRTFRRMLEHSLCADGFGSDMAALDWADACLLVLPCGRSAHLEAGYARGCGKPTAIYLHDGEPELMYRMADRLLVDDEELDAWVGSLSLTDDAAARTARDRVFRKIDSI